MVNYGVYGCMFKLGPYIEGRWGWSFYYGYRLLYSGLWWVNMVVGDDELR
jgi:hypothetical protein